MTSWWRKYERFLAVGSLALLAAAGFGLWYLETRKPALRVSLPAEEVQVVADTPLAVQLLVDVAGAVQSPGVYKLAPEARVEDALQAAGGLREDADLDQFALSRAAKVTDGQKIMVPRIGSAPVDSPVTVIEASSACINLNTAGAAELDRLPGIGEVRVNKIIEGRPFATPDQLVTEKIVPANVFADIKDQVCV